MAIEYVTYLQTCIFASQGSSYFLAQPKSQMHEALNPRPPIIIGSLSKHDVDDSKNVI